MKVMFFIRWHATVQVKSNTEFYSSFASIYINAVISLRLAWVEWGCEKGFAWKAWLLINIAMVGVKVKVGLEKLLYKMSMTLLCHCNLELKPNNSI